MAPASGIENGIPAVLDKRLQTAMLSSLSAWLSTGRIIVILAVITFSTLILMKKLGTRRRNAFKLPPGPRPLPIIGNMHQLKGEPLHHRLDHLAAEHGPIMYLRLGAKPWVVASCAEAAEEFLKVQDKVWAGRSSTIFVRLATNKLKNIARAPYGPHWRHMRRICSLELFTQRRLQSFRTRRTEEIDRMVRLVFEDSKQGKVVALTSMLAQLATNNITRMLINKRFFGTETEGTMEARRFREPISSLTQEALHVRVGDVFPWLMWVMYASGSVAYMKKLKGTLNSFLQGFLEIKKANSTTNNEKNVDFVDVLLAQHSEDGTGPLEDDCIKAIIQVSAPPNVSTTQRTDSTVLPSSVSVTIVQESSVRVQYWIHIM